MEVEGIAQELQLTDPGRLLFLFELASKGREDVNEREVDGLVYLLTEKTILPFGYSFLLNPLPYSTRLHEDIYSLIQTGYLNKQNPVYITKKGSEWVVGLLLSHGYNWEAFTPLIQIMKDLLAVYRRKAFDLIYTAMTL